MPPPGTASALSIWPHVCACAHTLPSPGPKRIQPECSAQAAKLGPLAGTDEGVMSWVGVRLAWVTQGSGHRWDLQGRGGGGGVQLGEKGGAAVSWAPASSVLEGQVPRHSALPPP